MMPTATVETRMNGEWQLDPHRSSIEFRVRLFWGLGTVKGEFDDFDGQLDLGANPAIELTIDAASLQTGNRRRDRHLRSTDFFDVENHPTIEFASTRIEHAVRGDYRVTGDLTMHGETHPVTLDVTVHGVTRDAEGKDRVGLEARGTLNRSDFGLRWQQALETGGVLVGDEVRISADIAAVCDEREA